MFFELQTVFSNLSILTLIMQHDLFQSTCSIVENTLFSFLNLRLIYKYIIKSTPTLLALRTIQLIFLEIFTLEQS